MRAILLAFLLCVALPVQSWAEKLTVFVSILPQKYFVERVGGEHVDVKVMVQPGASPATYEPKPRQMAELSKAAIYFAIGVPFEKAWLPRFASASNDLMIIPSQKGITKYPMAAHSHGEQHDQVHHEKATHHEHTEHHEHDAHHAKEGHHEHEGGHSQEAHHEDEAHHQDAHHETEDDHAHGHHHGILDPHVWLSPPLVKIIAANMRKALAEADPEHAANYAANLEAFHKECDGLHARLEELLAPLSPPHNAFMVFHPSWGYFARTYGLRQIAIEVEGKDPSPSELKEIIDTARGQDVHVVFVQPQFSRASAELVAKSIGGRVEALDPLAEDWHKNLLHAAESIAKAVEDR